MSENQTQHVEVIWGNPILDEGFTTIPNLIIKNYTRVGLTHAEYGLLTILFSFKRDSNDPFPSQETLAKIFYGDSYKPGTSERALRKVLSGIENKGLLEMGYRYINGKRSSSVYNFGPLIEACLQFVKPKKEPAGSVVVTVAKKKKLPEQKVPVVEEPEVPVESAPKVPVGQEPEVPIKKKREKDRFKKKNEKESIYLEIEKLTDLDVKPNIQKTLMNKIDRLIQFNLNVFEIGLHAKSAEEVYSANEYAFTLDSLLSKMKKRPDSFGAVMDNWLARNRKREFPDKPSANKSSHPVPNVKGTNKDALDFTRTEPISDYILEDERKKAEAEKKIQEQIARVQPHQNEEQLDAFIPLLERFRQHTEKKGIENCDFLVWLEEESKKYNVSAWDFKAIQDAYLAEFEVKRAELEARIKNRKKAN